MKIFTIDDSLINDGKTVFSIFARQSLGRPQTIAKTRRRASGAFVIPGAIVAAIEIGIVKAEEIIPMVARASRCWESTVSLVLDHVAQQSTGARLWYQDCHDTYHLSAPAAIQPLTLLIV